MRMLTSCLALAAALLAAAPTRGQQPSDTLKKSTQEGWYTDVQKFLRLQRLRQRFPDVAQKISAAFLAADKLVVLDVGPADKPQLTYDKVTSTVTWTLYLRPGVKLPQADVEKAVRALVVNIAGQEGKLIEQKDVEPGGALKIKVVLLAVPPVDPAELARRLDKLEAELKKYEDLKADLKKLDGIRRELRELSENLEEIRRRLSGTAGGRTPALVTPGAVWWYNPYQGWAYHWYPSVGYSGVPAYYAVWLPRTPPTGPQWQRLREQVEQGRRTLAALTRQVQEMYEKAFGEEAAALEPAPDLRGLEPRDAERLFLRARQLYWEGEYAAALVNLRTAIGLRELDARSWSFKALAERALGEDVAADVSARRAAALRQLGLPDRDRFGRGLERIQGGERRFLNSFVKTPTRGAS